MPFISDFYTQLIEPLVEPLQALVSDDVLQLVTNLQAEDIEISFDDIFMRLHRFIALLDELLTEQINLVLHHPRFQRLEASWRGVAYLTEQVPGNKKLKVRILDINKEILTKDVRRVIEFDQSQLFQKIYTNEFGRPGGEPFGLLIGDYQVSHLHVQHEEMLSVDVLHAMTKIAAAAFVPFIVSANPVLFGLDNFVGLQMPVDLSTIFKQAEYLPWRTLQQDEDCRFLGVTLPYILMRLPYKPTVRRIDEFCFTEDVSASEQHNFLWGHVGYALAGVVMRAFKNTGWLIDICGTNHTVGASGIVADLPRQNFATDKADIATKYATNVCISDKKEKVLSDLGFIALCECKYTNLAAFYNCKSLQHAKVYSTDAATVSAELSSMLQYTLCLSRFAHYVKVMMREKVGSFISANECQVFLQNWLLTYTAASDNLTPELEIKYPLKEARVKVIEAIGKPGIFNCIVDLHLHEHYAMKDLQGKLHMVTEFVRQD